MAARVPSSHGSLDGGEAAAGAESVERGDVQPSGSEGEADGFNSDEFREWLRERANRRRDVGRPRRDGRGRRGEVESEEEERGPGGKGLGAGLPPEWDSSTNFQDWAIKARLWLATTRAKGHTQGPLMLQRLSGQAFQSFKHWAKDAEWLKDPQGGHRLLASMDTPEYFGEDTEEELLSSLSKLTYHLKRGKEETCRQFFTRWDDAVRRIGEHKVTLPDRYLGFLLINALGLSEQDTKALMAFSRGSILVNDVKEWCRKHEMKLQARDVGVERKGGSKTYQSYATTTVEPEDEDELQAMEEIYRELHPDEGGEEGSELGTEDFEDALEEHEAKEILNTLVTSKKKTFMQSLKTKRAKALARGYGQWKDKGNFSSSRSQSSMATSGYVKGGYYRMTLSEAKAKSKCSKCGQIGHWHRDPECPRNQGRPNTSNTKEVNLVETEKAFKTDEAIFCGHLEPLLTESETTEKSAPVCPGTTQDTNVAENGPAVQILDQSGLSNFCQGYKDRVSTVCDGIGCKAGDGFCVCSQEPFPIFWSEINRKSDWVPDETPDELCATIDTGCQRMAIGLNTLQKFDQALPSGLQTQLNRQEHKFRSVHGTSTTKFAAVIPTSLGSKGSLLRPAIFDNPESRDAPFLISLPFLMHCRAVLHLDPSQGLSMELKRFGCHVKCHLGPSGALRVPLGQFTKEMMKRIRIAQQQFQGQETEFEILRTTQVFAQAPSDSQAVDPSALPGSHDTNDSHGCSGRDKAVPHECRHDGRAHDGVAAASDEGALCGGPHDRDDGALGWNGSPSTCPGLLNVPSSTGSLCHRDTLRDCRGGGRDGQLGGCFPSRDRERAQLPTEVSHTNVSSTRLAGIQYGAVLRKSRRTRARATE